MSNVIAVVLFPQALQILNLRIHCLGLGQQSLILCSVAGIQLFLGVFQMGRTLRLQIVQFGTGSAEIDIGHFRILH